MHSKEIRTIRESFYAFLSMFGIISPLKWKIVYFVWLYVRNLLLCKFLDKHLHIILTFFFVRQFCFFGLKNLTYIHTTGHCLCNMIHSSCIGLLGIHRVGYPHYKNIKRTGNIGMHLRSIIRWVSSLWMESKTKLHSDIGFRKKINK